MKRTLPLLLTAVCLLPAFLAISQVPSVILQRCFGGSRWENLGNRVRAQNTADSGYIFITNTNSNDGDVQGLHTDGSGTLNNDIWVVKVSKYGGLQWQRCYGSIQHDYANAIDTGSNNTYFITGTVYANGGDITGVQRPLDPWVAKLDSKGNILWQKSLGGSLSDNIQSIKSTPDGGCLLVGSTNSNDGTVSGNHYPVADPNAIAGYDGWVTKLDATGNITWSRCYGSTATDGFNAVIPTTDGNYLLAGSTNGSDGDVSGRHTGFLLNENDGWGVKIDKAGNILWSRCYGGGDGDGFSAVQQAPDGGYIYAGTSNSNSEQAIGGHGIQGPDAWLLKTDAAGNFIWGRCYGGAFHESASSLTVDKDGFIFSGECSQNHGDVQGGKFQGSNIWLVKTSFIGSITWQRVMGGDGDDHNGSVLMAYDGYPAIFGNTTSMNGDVRHPHVRSVPDNDAADIWFAKIASYNTVTINGFADLNSNGVKDNGEPFYPYYKADVSKNGVLVDSYSPDIDTLELRTDSGSFNIALQSFFSYYAPVPVMLSATFNGFFNTLNTKVAFKPTGTFNDLRINVVDLTGRRRAGWENTYRIMYENVGTTTLSAPVVTFVKDPATAHRRSSRTPASIVNDTLLYNLPGLAPLSKGYIDVTLQNNTTMRLGDTLRFNAAITPVTADATKEDNSFPLKEIVIASFDPNDKTENHGGLLTRAQVTGGEYLNYTIRFQNTGNDTAFLVVVRDTLSAQYDLSSLRVTGASHPYQFRLTGNYGAWSFYNINLVDSNHNEPASHGFISFRIKAKNTVPEGDSIRNSASIYFDYNAPVLTNRVSTVVKSGTVTAIDPVTRATAIHVFPNPVTDGRLVVQSKQAMRGKVHIRLFTEAGVPVMTWYVGKNLQEFVKELNISRLPKGSYIIVVESDQERFTSTLIKAG